jgi:hypothetical protein
MGLLPHPPFNPCVRQSAHGRQMVFAGTGLTPAGVAGRATGTA